MLSSRSRELYQRATKKIPGGVNSPVRAWKSVGGVPKFIARGKGSYVFDSDGKKYIDFVGSWGPLILGHADPHVLRAIHETAKHGTTFGAPVESEVALAELVSTLVPSIEKLRLVSSGTEATMSALRLARAFTRRTKIVKFDGCYHGHSDGLLVNAGSGVATLGIPGTPGIPAAYAKETLVGAYNDRKSIMRLFARYGRKIAAVIVEPVCGNMGVINPLPGFLDFLRKITRQHGALLIFDEVITGFRLSLGGAQQLYGVRPDLTCLGKVLGGGLPLAAFGGRARVMNWLAPLGPVYQAGTLSGNPIAVAAGLQTLRQLERPRAYETLEAKAAHLARGFRDVVERYRIRSALNRCGSMMTLFFGVDEVRDVSQARSCDRKVFASFFHGMLQRGIYWPPAAFEAAFISLAHSIADLDRTIAAFADWAKKRASV